MKSIEKITKSMKMVSAAKLAKAQRNLELVRPIGEAAKGECQSALSPHPHPLPHVSFPQITRQHHGVAIGFCHIVSVCHARTIVQLICAVQQPYLSFPPERLFALCLPFSCRTRAPLHSVVFTDKAGVVIDAEKDTAKLFVAVCSDKGLCGGVHSAVNKRVKALVSELPAGTECVLSTVLPLPCSWTACWNHVV